jgi:hypothetical protein
MPTLPQVNPNTKPNPRASRVGVDAESQGMTATNTLGLDRLVLWHTTGAAVGCHSDNVLDSRDTLVVKREEVEEHRTVTELFDCPSESLTNFSALGGSELRSSHTAGDSSFGVGEYTKKIRMRVIRKVYKILHGERGVEELAAQKLSLDCEDKAFRNFRVSIEKYIGCVKVICMAVRVSY